MKIKEKVYSALVHHINCYENEKKITKYGEIPGDIKIPNHVYCCDRTKFKKYNCMIKYNRIKYNR